MILLLVACSGHHTPPPKQPPPAQPDPKGLARLVDEDMTQLGEIAHRLRGQCAELIAELRPHVTRMQQHYTETEKMLQSERYKDFKAEVAGYAQRAGTRSDQIAKDLSDTYLGCTDDRYQLEHVIADIPTY